MATVKVIAPPPVEQPPVKVQIEMTLDEAKAVFLLIGGTNQSDFAHILSKNSSWCPNADYQLLYPLYKTFSTALKGHIK